MSESGHTTSQPQKEQSPYEKEREWLKALASLYLEANRFKDSLHLLEALFLMFPKDVDVLRMMAQAYLQSDRHEEAIEATRRYLSTSEAKMNPGFKSVALYIQSKAYWRVGNREEARLAFSKFQKISEVPNL